MNQKEPVDRIDAIAHVARVIKVPLAVVSRPERMLALQYCDEFKITAKELIDYSYKKMMER